MSANMAKSAMCGQGTAVADSEYCVQAQPHHAVNFYVEKRVGGQTMHQLCPKLHEQNSLWCAAPSSLNGKHPTTQQPCLILLVSRGCQHEPS